MPSFQIRPFRRSDREQVTRLVNTHAAAVVPGVAASVNAVLSQFERETDEFIVEPWVDQRRVLVAEQEAAVVAAALIVRHRADEGVGPAYRNSGEIRWLLFRPLAPAGNPYWRDAGAAAQALITSCLDQFRDWKVERVHAGGSLPLPGVYGVPEAWPHVRRLYRDNGFTPDDAEEILFLADVAGLPVPAEPPLAGLRVRRLVGVNGVRFAAERAGDCLGYIETDILEAIERHPRHGGLADIGNRHVDPRHRRRGIGTWLLGHAAQWLRLGQVDRLLAYAAQDEPAEIGFLGRHGFVEITRTLRGWHRSP